MEFASHDRPPGSAGRNSEPVPQHNDSQDRFIKTTVHSSQLDSPSFEVKASERVVVIGSGASAVEAVGTVLDRFNGDHDSENQLTPGNAEGNAEMEKGIEIYMVSPDDIAMDTFIAGQPFGRQPPSSFLWDAFLRQWQYSELKNSHPKIKESTKARRSDRKRRLFMPGSLWTLLLRAWRTRVCYKGWSIGYGPNEKGQVEKVCRWIFPESRGSVEEILEGEEKLIHADVIVLATGYKEPSIDFLPQDLFPEGYRRPDLYLQHFSTEDWSILMTNSAYMKAIGTVGHLHIGIYTRILLTLLLDKSTRPTPKDMKLWVDVRFTKLGARGGAFGFFTYMELMIWWLFFITNGWGVYAETETSGEPRKDVDRGRFL